MVIIKNRGKTSEFPSVGTMLTLFFQVFDYGNKKAKDKTKLNEERDYNKKAQDKRRRIRSSSHNHSSIQKMAFVQMHSILGHYVKLECCAVILEFSKGVFQLFCV
ncbi:hypothetical protein BSR03_27080 [Serratia proteamaculans]|nr:hypothetical protein BSR03_27080 [Serratia proteamaculans]